MADGSRRRIASVRESTWGTFGGTTLLTNRALGGAGISSDRSSFVSQEFRTDRAISGHKLGVERTTVAMPFELSYISYDDYIESALCNSWTLPAAPITGLSVTVVAGVTNTMAATGIGAGISVGDWVRVSGFTAPNLANNGFWRVTASTANLITLGDARNAAGTSMLVAAGPIAGITVRRMGWVTTGTAIRSLSIEEGFTDINVFLCALGCMVNEFSLSIQPDAIITGAFSLMARELMADSPRATQYGAVYTAADTNQKIDTFSGFLRINGQVSGVITGCELSLNNNLEALIPIFQMAANRMGMGRSNLTGTVSLYMMDGSFITRFRAETPISLSIMLMESDMSRGYSIDIPVARLNTPTRTVEENNVIMSLPFQALPDPVSGLVNWRWNRLE